MKGDFAKIVRASHGQQVLIYHEPDTESNDEDNGNVVVHCMVSLGIAVVDLKARVTCSDDEDVKRYMDTLDQAWADRFIVEMEKLLNGGQ